jgi:anion-transporting  ArsA/GET3 family ATPase
MIIKVDPAKAQAQKKSQQEALRQAAYAIEADPIAMQMLRNEATKEEWLAKIGEIKARYPYPEEPAQ